MVKLPDSTAIRVPVVQDGRRAPSPDVSSMGRAVAGFGHVVSELGEQRQHNTDKLELANATSYFNTSALQQKNDIERATSIDVDTETQRSTEALERAAQGISNAERRAQFLASNRDNAAQIGILAQQKRFKIDRDTGMANGLETLNARRDALLKSGDPADLDRAVTDVHNVIDGWQAKGWIDRQKAVDLKAGWAEDYATGKLKSLPPLEQSEILAGTWAARADRTPHGAMLDRLAQEKGIDPNLVKTFAFIESGGNPNNVTGSYKGLFQLSDAEFAKYGSGDIFNPEDNARAGIAKLQADVAAFRKQYGRDPSATDLYLIHNQGAGGYAAHIANPNGLAWQAMASTAEGKQRGDAWAKEAIWRNVPDDVKSQYPGGVESLTSRQFMDLWNRKVTGGSASTHIGLADAIPLDKRQDLLRRAQAQLFEGERARRLEQARFKDGSDTEEQALFARIHTDDANLSLSRDILDNKKLTREAMERLTHQYENRTKDRPEALYGKGFWGFYERIHKPDGDPERLSDPAQIYAEARKGGSLTPSGVDKLITEMRGKKTPEGEAEAQLKNQFFKNARAQITGTNDGLHIRDPKGDDLFQRFQVQALKAYEDGRAAGKSPYALLDPSSAEYIGKSIPQYKRPMSEWFADMVNSGVPNPENVQKAATFDPAAVKSLAELQEAYLAGRVTREVAMRIATERGWAARRPETPQVPISR